MLLIADGGSTKVDWITLDNNKNEVFRTQTTGLNPAVIEKQELKNRVLQNKELIKIKNEVKEIHFYGAGCGTPKASNILQIVLKNIFINASIHISEDMLAAVYASAGKKPAIVCILGTGSNSCYFDGKNINTTSPSLGYTIMDEASGNYFGKLLLRDYFYKKMPLEIASQFENQFNLDTDFIKMNLYRKPNPNKYLASFAKFMIDFKDNIYIKNRIEKGFFEFFDYYVLPYKLATKTPIYFIGSIAFYFRETLEKVAKKHDLQITDVIQRPIDNLVNYHKENIN